MKRANIECFGNKYHGYYLIENLDDAYEYEDSIWKNRVFETADDLLESSKRNFIGHCTTKLGNITHSISGIKGQGWLITLTELMGNVSAKRLMYICEGKKLAINNSGGYFPIPNDAQIELLPDYIYTEKDINITQFEGGKHWYATVGGIDVIDDFFGRQFNTYDYAHQTAIKFMKQLNEQKS
jgi:hypothetical protein